jgi:hypothetical protein
LELVLQRHKIRVGGDKTTRQNPCDSKQCDGVFLKQFYIGNVKVGILQSTDFRPVRPIQQRGKFAEDRAGFIPSSEDGRIFDNFNLTALQEK